MSASLPVKNADGATELLVVGRAPETAAKVRLVEDGQVAVEAAVTPSQSTAIGGNVWVMSIPAEISEGELEWVDTDSNVTAPGSPTSGWFDRLDAIKRIGKPPT